MNTAYNAVLFDFDGTVADTGCGIFNGIRYALNAFGMPMPEEHTLRRFIGPPLHDSFKEIFGMDAARCAEAVKIYREYYVRQGMFELTVYDGMRELLARLHERGTRLGIASSKPEVFLRQITAHLELDDLFDVVAGSDIQYIHSDKAGIIRRAMETLALADAERALMVGDRYFDIEGAKSVGIDSVGVLFGYGERDELEAAGATYIAAAPEEIYPLAVGE